MTSVDPKSKIELSSECLFSRWLSSRRYIDGKDRAEDILSEALIKARNERLTQQGMKIVKDKFWLAGELPPEDHRTLQKAIEPLNPYVILRDDSIDRLVLHGYAHQMNELQFAKHAFEQEGFSCCFDNHDNLHNPASAIALVVTWKRAEP